MHETNHIASNVNRITNGQEEVHKNLERIVKKHFSHPYRRPVAQHTQQAFDAVRDKVENHLKSAAPLIFDSCCGTAMSTQIIAKENPHALVLGIDRSAVRLAKESNLKAPDNAVLIQAECADFWRLAVDAGWELEKHTILYPNPYPKSKHLKRRWHAHPAFPYLLALGGELELRSNWKVYMDEFCEAVKYLENKDYICKGVEVINIAQAMTLFEKKYQESGQDLYLCQVHLKS